MPIFGDLAKMFQNQGPVNWDMARQIGAFMAAEGQAEVNVDPLERIRLEELARVAELHISDATGLATSIAGRPVTVRVTTRGEWAGATLEAYKELFLQLATSMGAPASGEEGGAGEAGDVLELLDHHGRGPGLPPERTLGGDQDEAAPGLTDARLPLHPRAEMCR